MNFEFRLKYLYLNGFSSMDSKPILIGDWVQWRVDYDAATTMVNTMPNWIEFLLFEWTKIVFNNHSDSVQLQLSFIIRAIPYLPLRAVSQRPLLPVKYAWPVRHFGITDFRKTPLCCLILIHKLLKLIRLHCRVRCYEKGNKQWVIIWTRSVLTTNNRI